MKKLLALTEAHVRLLLATQLNVHIVYHNLLHTEQVVESAFEIGFAEGLTPDELELVQVAAWFHDVGFIHSNKGHEAHSISMASDFLSFQGASESFIGEVCACIRATELPQTPSSRLAEVLADADLAGLAKENFWERSLLLRQEWKNTNTASFSEEEWCRSNRDFLAGHAYFTGYARRELQPLKSNNFLRCIEELNKFKFRP